MFNSTTKLSSLFLFTSVFPISKPVLFILPVPMNIPIPNMNTAHIDEIALSIY